MRKLYLLIISNTSHDICLSFNVFSFKHFKNLFLVVTLKRNDRGVQKLFCDFSSDSSKHRKQNTSGDVHFNDIVPPVATAET